MKEGVPSDRSWGSEEQRENLRDRRGNRRKGGAANDVGGLKARRL